MIELLLSLWTHLPNSSQFWAGIIGAVVGAIVGGVISYFIQRSALREARDQRREDDLRTQRALAHALLFKVIRIHSDFDAIYSHVEGCIEKAANEGFKGEPWQFVLPPANIPDAVKFSSEEMGMLLSLKNDDVFNKIAAMDVNTIAL